MGWVWPPIGWRRATRYALLRLQRVPASPYSIAAGFACGAAISFTPLLGLHLLLSALWALAIRGNVLSSAIGTFVGNPWTAGFIWVSTYEVGDWIVDEALARGSEHPTRNVDFPALFGGLMESMLRLDLAHMIAEIWPVWFPMLIGSVPMMAVVWLTFYFPVRAMVQVRQNRRRQHLAQRLAAQRAYPDRIEAQGDTSI